VASVHDVAAYILEKRGEMTAMKLEKLVYYAQAWSLVWDEVPLFREEIEAWANGPVVPALYREHKGLFKVKEWPKGNPQRLNATQRATVDAVLKAYGNKSSQWLSALTHMEAPWRDAREGLLPGQISRRQITHAAMAEYYGSLTK
jgi:uncharacterized phage-associated protein